MKTLSSLIANLTPEEKQAFRAYLNAKNQRGDVRNMTLFNLLTKGNTKAVDEKIYGRPNRNAFHALCKRLQDNLIDFTAAQSFAGEASEEMEILKLLLASRIFFEQKQDKIAFKTLAKAEKWAEHLDLYSILTEIHQTHLQYAHLNPKVALSELIEKSQENLMLFQRQFQLNQAYARIKERLSAPESKNVQEVVTETFEQSGIRLEESLTYKSLYQLLNLTSTVAKLQSDYHSIAPFMLEAHAILTAKSGQADKHLFYHLEVLYLMAESSFRNKDFVHCTSLLDEMQGAMLRKNGKYASLFSDKYSAIKALNLNYSGEATKAISLLEKNTSDNLNIRLILILCLFQQNEFKAAYQVFKDLNHSDTFYEKKAGWLLVLKKSIMEILLLIELDRLDLVLSRLKGFKRKYKKRLQELGESRALTFIELVEIYYEDPTAVTTQIFKQKVETSFEWIGTEREDIFVMSFYAWLKAKMERTDLYGTTLGLLKAH